MAAAVLLLSSDGFEPGAWAQLRRLKAFLDEGLLTPEEFNKKKAMILAGDHFRL